jgi:hypothetical protein
MKHSNIGISSAGRYLLVSGVGLAVGEGVDVADGAIGVADLFGVAVGTTGVAVGRDDTVGAAPGIAVESTVGEGVM